MVEKIRHVPSSTRATCPICKKPVYSRAGIHPQCAMIQAEPPRARKPIAPASSDEPLPK